MSGQEKVLLQSFSDSTRRTVLKIAAGVGAISTLGSTPTTAQGTDIEIQHSLVNFSSTTIPSEEFDSAASNHLNIREADFNRITFGGDAGRTLRVTNLDTGRQVTLDPVADSETVTARRLRPEPDGEPDPNGIVSTTVRAIGLEDQDESVDLEVDVSGDTDPFPDGTFGRFEVELLDDSNTILSSTDGRIVGTGYQYNFEQDGHIVRITRDPAVDEAWEVAFGVDENGVSLVGETDGAVLVDNNAEDDEFEIDLTELDVAPGEYRWELTIATEGTDLEAYDSSDMAATEIILQASDLLLDPVVIGEWTEIEDWHDLNDIRNDLDGDYVLVNDLDEDTDGYETYVGDQDGFAPIGTIGEEFTGTLDGTGHVIKDLIIDRQEGAEVEVGLFGYVDTAEIRNLGLVDTDISGETIVGSFVGFSENSDFSNIYATGQVSGGSDSDGIRIGGLIGGDGGGSSIEDSYAIVDIGGQISADGFVLGVGGLVGEIDGGNIQRTFAAGSVSDFSDTGVGGLIGSTTAVLDLEDSYWDTVTSGQTDSADGSGLSTDEMQGTAAESNLDGFDFDTEWETVAADDSDSTADGYPLLQALGRTPQLESQGLADTQAAFTVTIDAPTDGDEVTEDEALTVDVAVTNTGADEATKTIELTTPIEDSTDVELAGDTTETVSFTIPGDAVVGDVQISVASPDDTDQVTVTAVDPCFIATAAYDTPTAAEIDVLRAFRDDVLQRNVLGRLFVKTYYWGSPPIADWIRRNSTRRDLVKQYFVDPLVRVVQRSHTTSSHEQE